jgi:hypothetical protein
MRNCYWVKPKNPKTYMDFYKVIKKLFPIDISLTE